jgi:glycosyltransferase involved in cell wall biosynthesis
MILDNIKCAENVTTTTPIFAEEISKYNKNVYVLPNAVDPTEKQFTPNSEPSERIRIGWLGGSSHLKDLEILNGVVTKLRGDNLIDKVQFVLCGFDIRGTHTEIDPVTKQSKTRPIQPWETVWFKYEKIFTDDYKIVSPEYKEFLLKYEQSEYPNVENEAYRRVWTKPISTYASNYNLFDISLAPIEENIFNKVKSQLKVIEAGFHHKAIIAQNYGPYQIDLKNAIQYGGSIDETANGILIDSNKNQKDWYSAIKKLIQNPELVKTLQNNLYETVKDTYSMDKVTENRRELYRKLLNL